MAKSLINTNAKFGTMSVFLTALSTILGAILFLRFGWAVGQVGFWGAIGIIILGHAVTFPQHLPLPKLQLINACREVVRIILSVVRLG